MLGGLYVASLSHRTVVYKDARADQPSCSRIFVVSMA